MLGNVSRSHHRRRRRHSRYRRKDHFQPYPLGRFLRAYVICLAIWIASMFLSMAIGFPVSPVVYFACGFYLTRFISRRVLWNQNFATIASIAQAKWAMFLAWPLQVLCLLWQIFLVKIL